MKTNSRWSKWRLQIEANRRTVSLKIVIASAKALPPSSSTAAAAADRLVELEPCVAHMLYGKVACSPQEPEPRCGGRWKWWNAKSQKRNKQLENLIDLKLHYLQLRCMDVCVRVLARSRSRACETQRVCVFCLSCTVLCEVRITLNEK